MPGTLLLIVVLLLAAMALIVVEICTPTFGVLGLAALGCVGWAVYLAYTVNGVFGLVMVIAVVVCFPIYIIAAVKILPKTPLGNRLHLCDSVDVLKEFLHSGVELGDGFIVEACCALGHL